MSKVQAGISFSQQRASEYQNWLQGTVGGWKHKISDSSWGMAIECLWGQVWERAEQSACMSIWHIALFFEGGLWPWQSGP